MEENSNYPSTIVILVVEDMMDIYTLNIEHLYIVTSQLIRGVSWSR